VTNILLAQRSGGADPRTPEFVGRHTFLIPSICVGYSESNLLSEEGVSSYSLMISLLSLPDRCSWTICSLNSFVNDLLDFLAMISSLLTYKVSSLYVLNENVQLSVTYS